MKRKTENLVYSLSLLFFALLQTAGAMAQDASGSGDKEGRVVSVTKTTTTTTHQWFTEPWVWAVGALVFILLLVALLRGNRTGRTDIHRTTIRRDVHTD